MRYRDGWADASYNFCCDRCDEFFSCYDNDCQFICWKCEKSLCEDCIPICRKECNPEKITTWGEGWEDEWMIEYTLDLKQD
jgi:hypothetical protein